jgi:hypothetical protein
LYYVNDTKSSHKGTFPLGSSCTVEVKPATAKRKFLLLLTDSDSKSKSKMLMNAPTADSRDEWIAKIEEVVNLMSGKQSVPLVVAKESSLKNAVPSKSYVGMTTEGGIVNGIPKLVMKIKVATGKVFVNVCCDDGIAPLGVIVGENCPHPVPDKEGCISDTYDVCINSQTTEDDFNSKVNLLRSETVLYVIILKALLCAALSVCSNCLDYRSS